MHDAVGVKVPVALDAKVTVPVGVIAPVPDESETVAVHRVPCPALTLAGEQVTLVDEERIVEARVNVPLLPLWTLSPP